MNPEQKSELRHLMAELSPADRKSILKEAQTLRANVQRIKNHPRARWSPEQWVLQLLRERTVSEVPRATVISIQRERCLVRIESEDRECSLAREIGERQQTALAPGDEVRVEPYGDGWRVNEVYPRRTELLRRDPGARQVARAIVANVDIVAVVVSVVAPPFHPRLIDRYLAAIYPGRAQPILVVNKIDLCETADELDRELVGLAPYASADLPILTVSTASQTGLEPLREALQGKLAAFVGHSGVGKSSLVTAMLPNSGAEAGSVSEGTGKGRHTTTSSTLIEADGLRIIDTPGIREFAPVFRSTDDVMAAFPEFERLGRCRFGDCLHRQEPDCAIRAAVREHRLPGARYSMYRRLLGEILDEGETEPPDGFTCGGCGNWVAAVGGGTEHRNHCPNCLASRHMDDVPGDRASGCQGMMDAIAVWVRKGGEWAIVHRCRECGKLGSNRIAADDNEALLLSLAVRPLSSPPFPLWNVGVR